MSNYMWAKPGTDYTFDHLDFEVREYNPSIAEQLGSVFSLYGIFHLLFLLSIFGAIVAAIVLIVQTL